jgi:hypothetical protein
LINNLIKCREFLATAAKLQVIFGLLSVRSNLLFPGIINLKVGKASGGERTTVESTSGGDPEDPDGDGGRSSHDASDHSGNPDRVVVRRPRVARGVLAFEIMGDNKVMKNRDTDGGSSGGVLGITDVEMDLSLARRCNDDSAQEYEGGRCGEVGSAQAIDPNLGDNRMSRNSITIPGRIPARRPRVPAVLDPRCQSTEINTVMEKGRRCLSPRRPRVPVLDLHQQDTEAKVCLSVDSKIIHGNEDNDDECKFIEDCGHQLLADPAVDLRPHWLQV